MTSFSMPPHPEEINAQNILVRLVDSIKFRFQLANMDLTVADHGFKINPTGKSLGELLNHIYKLQLTTLAALHPDHLYPATSPAETITDDTILILNSIRLKLLNIKDSSDFDKVNLQGLSFWNLINGPLADTLTHIGQVNIIKRALAKPIRKSSMIKGIYISEEPT